MPVSLSTRFRCHDCGRVEHGSIFNKMFRVLPKGWRFRTESIRLLDAHGNDRGHYKPASCSECASAVDRLADLAR